MFIIPFNRDIDSGKVPLDVIVLVAINTVLLPTAYIDPRTTYAHFGFIPGTPSVFTALTSMFLHGGFWHLAGNMFFLWMFGNRVEAYLGRAFFPLFYLLCGFGAALLHMMMNTGSSIPCVGASGAISGIAGAYFVLFPRSRFDLDVYLLRWQVYTVQTHTHAAVGVWFVEQLLLGLITTAGLALSTAFWGHVGGFVTGATGAALIRVIKPVEKWQASRDPTLEESDSYAGGNAGLITLGLETPHAKKHKTHKAN